MFNIFQDIHDIWKCYNSYNHLFFDQGEKKIHVVTKKEDGIHKSQVNAMVSRKEDRIHKNLVADEESQRKFLKQKMLFDQQQREIQVGNQGWYLSRLIFAIS